MLRIRIILPDPDQYLGPADPHPDAEPYPDPFYFVKDTIKFKNFFEKRKTKHFILKTLTFKT